jgi:glutaminase
VTGRLLEIPEQTLHQWIAQIQQGNHSGRLPSYIPKITTVQSHTIGLSIQAQHLPSIQCGAFQQHFSLMSLMKPFLLLHLLEQQDEATVFQSVGSQPSDQPFHSLKQLAADRGWPRNPMINSGAICLAEQLVGATGAERCEYFCHWLNAMAQTNLILDYEMLDSVRSLPNDANHAIAQILYNSGAIGDLERAIDTYNHLCCLSLDVKMLAQLGSLLALPHPKLHRRSQQIVNTLMFTCGVYEASSEWGLRMGLPIKSGVSGGILAIVPRQGAIGIYAPLVDESGNSIFGALLLEKIVQHLQLSLF